MERNNEYICPHCRKPIYDEEALLCLYCGESLPRSAGILGDFPVLKKDKFLLFGVMLMVILGLMIWIFMTI